MTGRAYQQLKPRAGLGVTAAACASMAGRSTTSSSFRNDHVIVWLTGTGDHPSG